MKNLEIERKFLVVNKDYKQLAISRYTIMQGYLCKEPDRTVRVRIKTIQEGQGKAFLTIKSKPNNMGFSRFEWEKEIDVEDAKQLIQMCPNPIEKTRWLVPAEVEKLSDESVSAVWEVDEFHGRLEGFVMAELELENEKQTFCTPAFVGEEVTGDPRYYNANM